MILVFIYGTIVENRASSKPNSPSDTIFIELYEQEIDK